MTSRCAAGAVKSRCAAARRRRRVAVRRRDRWIRRLVVTAASALAALTRARKARPGPVGPYCTGPVVPRAAVGASREGE
ncbi:hypothetical protein [Streptomyces albireticuli]|uniref:hypothetical protein n=1 Tax=Streptomyces albireticuli TaxID=1940 RepID=UPI00117D2C0F|nr:hypothetical protein [Streptomyces albireticuli]MCD9144421.1 hypothetical protein [Streptomyces albireticuli]MCD9163516.1 hypothetical protein [Streptomyces albireticuli]MCD9193098.1 hypothetical protein [Streptomyces albireticuli]